jgi:hypothetical protein
LSFSPGHAQSHIGVTSAAPIGNIYTKSCGKYFALGKAQAAHAARRIGMARMLLLHNVDLDNFY